jgi:tetratricopeptide (TPR) repeat protein
MRHGWEASGAVSGDGALARGREAAERLAWADAYTSLSLADQSSPLEAEDLELLATAAHLLGHMDDCLRALQRAQQLYAEGGDHRRAARCAGWLGFHLSTRGDLAQASGWFGRAHRLLEHERQECAEHGYLLVSAAYQQLMAGDHAQARETLAQAAGIGARVGDADLVAFALCLQGRALVWEDRVDEGLALLDEAMVAVVAGENLAPGRRHGLLRHDRDLPGDRRVAPRPGVDRGADGLVRRAAGHGHLHRPVPGPPGRDPAAARRLAGGGPGGQAGG